MRNFAAMAFAVTLPLLAATAIAVPAPAAAPSGPNAAHDAASLALVGGGLVAVGLLSARRKVA